MGTLRYEEKEKELIREIIKGISGLDYRGLLSYVIHQEMKKAEMYNTLSLLSEEVTWDQRVANLFKVMYRDSVRNAEALLEVFKKKFPGENPQEPEKRFLEVELSEGHLRELAYRGNLEEILEHMIEIEKLTAEIYRHLIEKISDEDVKGLLLSLSETGTERIKKLGAVLSSVGERKRKK